MTFDTFSEEAKQSIISDIGRDFAVADKTIDLLPENARRAVRMSYRYYVNLLDRLAEAPVEVIKRQRIRVPNIQKINMLLRAQGSRG